MKIRGVTRDPSSEKAKAWIAKGVEIVKGEFDDTASLKSAFQGATVIFGMTDFWAILQNPASCQKLKPGQDIAQYSHEVEIQQSKNLVDAAASVQGLERFIFSGTPDQAEYGTHYKRLWHVDSKPKVSAYIKDSHPDLHEKASEIHLS